MRHDSPSPSPQGRKVARYDDSSGTTSDSSEEKRRRKKKHKRKKRKKKQKKEEKKAKKASTKELDRSRGPQIEKIYEGSPRYQNDVSKTNVDNRGILQSNDVTDDNTEDSSSRSFKARKRMVNKSGSVTETFGNGGLITYPPGYIFEDGGGSPNVGEGDCPSQNTISTKSDTADVSTKGRSVDFFAALHAQENKKGPVGTVHATGENVGTAVSGQGIMAGVRTSTIRPTGMGGGAIPHDQALLQTTGEWECTKCGTKNPKNNFQCKSCGAMRRM